jgi:hypothetical protein
MSKQQSQAQLDLTGSVGGGSNRRSDGRDQIAIYDANIQGNYALDAAGLSTLQNL